MAETRLAQMWLLVGGRWWMVTPPVPGKRERTKLFVMRESERAAYLRRWKLTPNITC